MIDIDYELTQYISSALWSTPVDSTYAAAHDLPEDRSLERENFSADDIAPEALASMREDLQGFIDGADDHALEFWQAELGAGQVGHDFWLTRNGHGAGFWDRFMRGVGADFGQHLTEAAKAYGESDLYIGDDGRLYVS